MNAYNDFLGEVLSETYRTGKPRKANVTNEITLSKKRLQGELSKRAEEQGRDIADVSLDTVVENTGALQKYVTSRGEVPLTNPVELATQAFLLRQNEIDDYATAMQISRDEAEIYLDEAEEKAASISSPEADNFLGGLFAAVGNVAGAGLKKINDKRAEKGKKPGVLGFLGNLFPAQNSGVELPENTATKDDLKLMAGSIFEQVKANEKAKEIKKMLPLIIIGVVVLVVAVVLITKKTSK
jgi:hypothetical protein